MDTRARGRLNEFEVLKAVANCGWLTSRQLSKWVWSDSASGTAMNKTLLVTGRLLKMRYLLRRQTPTGVTAWILTKSGAAHLNKHLLDTGYSRGWAKSGYDISPLQATKQEAVVAALTLSRNQGLAAVGAAGIRAGLVAPEFRHFDGVAINPYTGDTTGFVHVYNCSERTLSKLQKLKPLCQISLVGSQATVNRITF